MQDTVVSKNVEIKNLKLVIIKTLVFFDLFNQPLSLFEIYKYLNIKAELFEILDCLENLKDKIENKDGFYYLQGREKLVKERFKKYNYFKRKTKKAFLFSKLISFFPTVRGVAVSNIIADHNLRDESDIDLFIISSKNKIWLTRFFCVSLAKFLNLRPNRKTKKDKICLSFYVSEGNLNLEKYLYNQKDLYFIYWLIGLQILVNKGGVFNRLELENKWIKKYLPNIGETIFSSIVPIKDDFQLFLDLDINPSKLPQVQDWKNKKNKDSKGFFENLSKKIQLKIMPNELKSKECDFGGVILKDDIIKLFLEDKRPEFIERFESNLKKYL
ncbi:MAG: hypothetical protein WCY43_01735 [Patescibacteria group bacterium]|nr:hypothetical protein [Patescibacteria group bacterium]